MDGGQVYVDIRDDEALDNLLAQTKGRDVQGVGTANLAHAQDLKDYHNNLPVHRRNRCGPLALRELFRSLNPGAQLPKGKLKRTNYERGMGASLSDLLADSERYGLKMQMDAVRAPSLGGSIVSETISLASVLISDRRHDPKTRSLQKETKRTKTGRS